MDHVIGGKFKLGRKIGSGSFGELYLGKHFMSIAFITLAFGLCTSFDPLVLLFVSGVNVQSGEEVAVKLVSAIIELHWVFGIVKCLKVFIMFLFFIVHRCIFLSVPFYFSYVLVYNSLKLCVCIFFLTV